MQRVEAKIKKIWNNSEFCEARIIFYVALFIDYIIVAYIVKIQCTGCPLCGMTRAMKCLLTFKFKEAFNYNKLIMIFCIIIPMILIDTGCIVYLKINAQSKK